MAAPKYPKSNFSGDATLILKSKNLLLFLSVTNWPITFKAVVIAVIVNNAPSIHISSTFPAATI